MKRNTLYILDDSELDLAILNEIFKRDFQVTCFSSANLLLSALREQHQQVCAILLDVCLNRRNEGLSILRRLQEHPNFSNIPIILIASDANRENVMDGIELGAIDFLAKPVNPHYVRERVLNTVAAVWNEAPLEQSKKIHPWRQIRRNQPIFLHYLRKRLPMPFPPAVPLAVQVLSFFFQRTLRAFPVVGLSGWLCFANTVLASHWGRSGIFRN